MGCDLEADEAPETAFELRSLAFTADHHGQRLDRALALLLPEFSRSHLQHLIALGDVRIQGVVTTKPSVRVRAGSWAQVVLRPTAQSQAFRPETGEVVVVFEDEHLLVVDKPAGLVVHPAPGNWSGTLMNRLLGRDPRAVHLPRAGIVHRLDKDTSGLMVVARTRPTMETLVRMLAARSIRRQYLALVRGAWRHGQPIEVVQPIGRDPNHRLRMAVREPGGGKPAHSTLCGLTHNDQYSLLHCSLQTGRTHQIRVHCAWLGHPLLGDGLYGGPVGAIWPRQALHATWLAFAHPVHGQPLRFFSAPPDDFCRMQRAAGLDYNPAAHGV
ncbi:MAG: RluA family pseudouridine synthase [Rhodoferax sp.]